MKIRRGTIKDLKEIAELDYLFFKGFLKTNPWLDKKHCLANFLLPLRKKISNKNRIFFVLEDNHSLVGFSSGEISQNYFYFKEKKAGWLTDVFVMKRHRGKGLGEQLAKEVIGWLHKKGVKDISLKVYPKNNTAIGLYKKLGFKNYMMVMRK
jgi:ribosomal protein S18 acetylase RimI-like enzyme